MWYDVILCHILTSLDIYVSVDVGGTTKKTKPYKGVDNPKWNEYFEL